MLVSIITHAFENRGRDADDRERIAVHENLFAGDRSIGIETALPECVAQDDDRMRVLRLIFFSRKASTQDGFYSQHIEVVAADEFARGDLRAGAIAGIAAFAASDSRRSILQREQSGQSLVLLAQIDVVRVCNAAPGLAMLLAFSEKFDELIRSLHRQRSKQKTV